jgi:hypothetical protein
MPLKHPGPPKSWQVPAVQAPLVQSVSSAHAWPSPQPGQGPPQSTAVSAPFFTRSVQLGAAQTLLAQTPLSQSVALAHPPPAAHGGHAPPPQSTPVSAPFFTRSVQPGATQTPLAQALLAQSAGPAHPPPTAHAGHAPPPQSTSVSAPFFTLSVQLGATQRPPSQAPLSQSAPVTQWPPAPQGSASQPLLGSPSQSEKPCSQEASAHFPAAHDAAPWANAQATPQAPQSVSVVSDASQPFAATPSQSPRPASQVTGGQLLLVQPGVTSA